MRRLQAQPALQLAAPNNELQQQINQDRLQAEHNHNIAVQQRARAREAREAPAREAREARAREAREARAARAARARHRARAYDLYDAENVPLPDPEPGEDF